MRTCHVVLQFISLPPSLPSPSCLCSYHLSITCPSLLPSNVHVHVLPSSLSLHAGTDSVFQLKVWVLDVKRRRQLVPPHSLPLSHRSKLEWFGYVAMAHNVLSSIFSLSLSLPRFSERGVLLTYDTKGIVRLLSTVHYGGLSWLPILDTTKQVGNKSDHYFLIGMTHNPDEIR